MLILHRIFKQPIQHFQHCNSCMYSQIMTVHILLNHSWYSKCPSLACTHAYLLTYLVVVCQATLQLNN